MILQVFFGKFLEEGGQALPEELASGKQAWRSEAELASGKQAWRSEAELASGKQAWRSEAELASGKQAWRSEAELASGKQAWRSEAELASKAAFSNARLLARSLQSDMRSGARKRKKSLAERSEARKGQAIFGVHVCTSMAS